MIIKIPQKMNRVILYGSLICMTSALLLFFVYSSINNYYKEKLNSMNRECDRTMGYTYPFKNDRSGDMRFSIFVEREIFIWLWTKNFTGTVEVTLIDENGKTHYSISGTTFDKKEYITLPAGEYQFVTKFERVFFGSYLMGLNHSSLFLNTVLALQDEDGDGIPNSEESKLNTNHENRDTDGDSLSDYHELRKYLTNPLKKDSDGDGTIDSAWNERREYTYSIRAVVDLREPFEIDEMNDFFQDARKIGQLKDDITRVEVVLYPKADAYINASPYVPVSNEFTARTYTKNYSEEMRSQIRKITDGSKTDIQAVLALLKEMKKMHYISTDKDLGLGSDLPVPFYIHRDEQGNIHEEAYPEISGYSIDYIKERVLFADSMYRHKTHGACTSTSILQGAMLRAAGIPEKTIAAIPLIYFYETDGTKTSLKDQYNNGYKNLHGGSTIADHFFNLVYIGNQWVRLEQTINPSFDKLYIKIYDSNDPTDHNMYKYYNYKTWQEKRPYKYLSVIEQEPIHISVR